MLSNMDRNLTARCHLSAIKRHYLSNMVGRLLMSLSDNLVGAASFLYEYCEMHMVCLQKNGYIYSIVVLTPSQVI
jgi:hypothetical protein